MLWCNEILEYYDISYLIIVFVIVWLAAIYLALKLEKKGILDQKYLNYK